MYRPLWQSVANGRCGRSPRPSSTAESFAVLAAPATDPFVDESSDRVVGNLGSMLAAGHGRAAQSDTSTVGRVGCGGTQPSIPTDFPIPTALYVVAA